MVPSGIGGGRSGFRSSSRGRISCRPPMRVAPFASAAQRSYWFTHCWSSNTPRDPRIALACGYPIVDFRLSYVSHRSTTLRPRISSRPTVAAIEGNWVERSSPRVAKVRFLCVRTSQERSAGSTHKKPTFHGRGQVLAGPGTHVPGVSASRTPTSCAYLADHGRPGDRTADSGSPRCPPQVVGTVRKLRRRACRADWALVG